VVKFRFEAGAFHLFSQEGFEFIGLVAETGEPFLEVLFDGFGAGGSTTPADLAAKTAAIVVQNG
jgi:hypothetical protein